MADDLDGLAPDVVSFIPPNILEEIGKITAAFSILEDELNGFISDMLGAGSTAGQAVTFRIRNISDRIELAKTLVPVKIKFDDHREEATANLVKLGTLNDRRNVLVHYAIHQIKFNEDPDAHEVGYRKKDHRLREVPAEKAFKASDLRALAKEIRLLGRSIGVDASRHRIASGRPQREP